MAPTGRTSEQGHDVAAAARAFWPRRSSSNRRWLAHEIGQQPVMLFRPKSANVLEMPDFIGWLQLFASWFKRANWPQITCKSVLHGTAPWRRPRSKLCHVFGATVELERSPRNIFGSAGLRIDTCGLRHRPSPIALTQFGGDRLPRSIRHLWLGTAKKSLPEPAGLNRSRRQPSGHGRRDRLRNPQPPPLHRHRPAPPARRAQVCFF